MRVSGSKLHVSAAQLKKWPKEYIKKYATQEVILIENSNLLNLYTVITIKQGEDEINLTKHNYAFWGYKGTSLRGIL